MMLEDDQNSTNSDSCNDDAISKVLGPEHRGRVRGLGFGVTPSQMKVLGPQCEVTRRYERQLREVNSKLENFQAEMQELRNLMV